jgi:site-specific recombinase XerD
MRAAKTATSFSFLLQSFFTHRLIQQRRVSPHTISSYRDTFRLLLMFMQRRLQKPPSSMALEEVDAPLVAAFLEDSEKSRGISARSRNLRLTAIRSFFRYLSFEVPDQSAQIQRVLAIPNKRYARSIIHFLTRSEADALLAAPDRTTWSGRRDHALLLVALQTGLRLSELASLLPSDVNFGIGAHVRVLGKGRKERCTPLAKQTVAVLKAWLAEPLKFGAERLFPNARGGPLSPDGIEYIVTKHTIAARRACPSLQNKRVTPHVLRHTTAMGLLENGVDRAVIALWLGHESVETTQIYLEANMTLKEKALAKATLPNAAPGRYRPDDQLIAFLKAL